MNKAEAARTIITSTLPHVPFDGWTMRALNAGAVEAGYSKTDVIRVFPDGAVQAVETFFVESDLAMEQALSGYHLETMKIRARITLAVKLRLCVHNAHPEALRRAVSMLALPIYALRGLRTLYHTVDRIWYGIGDTSTDFNFYTKRATLAAVYAATLNHWLNDASPDRAATWDFLDRRIEDVMKIESIKHRIRQAIR